MKRHLQKAWHSVTTRAKQPATERRILTTDEDLDELIDKTLETSEVETYSRGESLGHAKKETVKGSEEKDSPPRGQAKGYGKKDVTDEDILELIDKTVETSEIETYSRGKSLGQAVKGSEEKDTPPRGQAEGHAKKEVTDEEVDDMIDEAFKGGETEKGGNAYAKGHGAPGKGDPAVELQSVLDELEKTNQAIDKLDAARAKRGGHGRASTNAKKGGYSFGWKRCGQWKEEEQPSRQQRKVEKGRQHLFDARSTSNVKLSSYKKLGSGFLYHAHYIKLECFTT